MNKRVYLIASATLIVGLFLGWLLFANSSEHVHDQLEHVDEEIWTCSMHPNVRSSEKGQCPICGMDLIPLDSENHEADAMSISMSPTAMQLANVQTTIIEKQTAKKKLRVTGKIVPDERLIFSQSSHIPGRVEQLNVSYTGQSVTQGQVLATIYSPELIVAQEELLEANSMKDVNPSLYEAARAKLLGWKLSDEQIDNFLKGNKVQEQFPVVADVTGIVLQKNVNLGDYISKGQSLYDIADLTKVWALFDIYEQDLPWIKKGSVISFSVQSAPGQIFKSKIQFIDPVINPNTRALAVRVEIENRNEILKPDMFATGSIESATSPHKKQIVIPKSAVMWTGERSVVYVLEPSSDEVRFVMREIVLGPSLGDSYIVKEGLGVGEEIATNGTFSIDAAAQLAGKPSMMNPTGSAAAAGHNHSSMDGSEHSSESTKTSVFKVYGNCSMCKQNIETAVQSVKGIIQADWNVVNKMISVKYDKTAVTLSSIKKKIAGAGYDSDDYRAADEVYDSLAACCHYERPK